MSHQSFDEQIRQSIGDLSSQVNPSATAWERMAQRLEQEGLTTTEPIITETTTENQEQSFDQAIREQLARHTEPTFQYRHWLMLSERLDEQEQRVAWLYRHKMAEISILILLLLAFANILSIPVRKLEALTAPIFNISKQTTQTEPNTIVVAQNNVGTFNTNPATLTFGLISNAARTPHTQTRQLSPDLLKKLDRKIALLPTPIINIKSDNVAIADKIPVLKPESATLTERNNKRPPLPYIKPEDKSRYLSFGIVSVVELNEIYTPEDYFYGKDIPAYLSYSLGGGGGFTLSRESKRMAFEMGLIHITKKYQPRDLDVFGSNSKGIKYKETLRNVQVNMFQMPLSYRYKFVTKPRVDYFASLGGILNVITQANYDAGRDYFVPAYALRSIDGVQPPSEIEEVKKFNAGLFEGGTIQDNTYLSAQAALGLEYKITNKISFLHQFTYQRHLTVDGIGANRNSFHAYSVWVGLKRSF